MIGKFKNFIIKIKEISQLPQVGISFIKYTKESRKKYEETYNYFTKPHRLKLFKNKTLGVALINLGEFQNYDEYYKSINGKNSAAYYARKALKRDYEFVEIDRNNYIDDIYEVNTSSSIRQGRKMSDGYLVKTDFYSNEKNYRYFGVLDSKKKLVAYCNIGFYGEFALVVTLLGHKQYLNDGVMYLMMVELNKLLFTEYKQQGYNFVMYDTFFGASDGLKKFKSKLGYKAYKVKWKWEN